MIKTTLLQDEPIKPLLEVDKILETFGIESPKVYDEVLFHLDSFLAPKNISFSILSFKNKILILEAEYPDNVLLSYEIDEIKELLNSLNDVVVKKVLIRKKLL